MAGFHLHSPILQRQDGGNFWKRDKGHGRPPGVEHGQKFNLHVEKKLYNESRRLGSQQKKFYLHSFLYIPEEAVTVVVSDLDRSFSVEKTVKIRPRKPQIIFYEEKPAEGPLYQTAMTQSFDMKQSEIVIRAEPYFLPKTLSTPSRSTGE